MAKAPRSWKVDIHEAIQKLENNMWAVQGMVHKGPLKRHMVLVKLASGQIVVYNAVPCDEPTVAPFRNFAMPAIKSSAKNLPAMKYSNE